MTKGAIIGDDGTVIARTSSGCPLRAQIPKDTRARVETHPAVAKITINWTELTQDEKAAAMSKARFNISQDDPETEVPATAKVIMIHPAKPESGSHRPPSISPRGSPSGASPSV